MSSFLKALFIVLAVIVVITAIAIGGGVYLWNKHGAGLIEEGKQTIAEGQEAGRNADNAACLAEALRRATAVKGLAASVRTSIFLRSCLLASRPTPEFCSTVPRRTDIMNSVQWRLAQCTQAGLSVDDGCGQLFDQVQQFCEERLSGQASSDRPQR